MKPCYESRLQVEHQDALEYFCFSEVRQSSLDRMAAIQIGLPMLDKAAESTHHQWSASAYDDIALVPATLTTVIVDATVTNLLLPIVGVAIAEMEELATDFAKMLGHLALQHGWSWNGEGHDEMWQIHQQLRLQSTTARASQSPDRLTTEHDCNYIAAATHRGSQERQDAMQRMRAFLLIEQEDRLMNRLDIIEPLLRDGLVVEDTLRGSDSQTISDCNTLHSALAEVNAQFLAVNFLTSTVEFFLDDEKAAGHLIADHGIADDRVCDETGSCWSAFVQAHT